MATWYSISITQQSNDLELFKGYFGKDNSNDIVKSFYNTTDRAYIYNLITTPSNLGCVGSASSMTAEGVFTLGSVTSGQVFVGSKVTVGKAEGVITGFLTGNAGPGTYQTDYWGDAIASTSFTAISYVTGNGPHDARQSNNVFWHNAWFIPQGWFPDGGTTITSIPKLDTIYSATKWNLWTVNHISFQTHRLSYFSGGSWTDLPDDFCSFVMAEIPDPSCFNEGTKILCLNKNLEEEYISVENLRKGDLVKSYKHGYRKIDLIGKNIMINNPQKCNKCMYKMEKTDDNGLIDDLIITGGHSILVDNLGEYKQITDKIFGLTQIDDKYVLHVSISNQFVKLDNTNLYTYYHFILENNENDDERFGVWANGILNETPSKKEFIKHKYTLL